MAKFPYPNQPVRCIITGPGECGESVFLTNLILNIIKEYDKVYIYSPSLQQDLYQKLYKCFTNYIPYHIIPNIINEENIDIIIDEVVNTKDFQKSDTEIETYESIERLKFPENYNSDQSIVIILDYLNQKKMEDSHVQAMFKRSRHNIKSIFVISQDYYELSKRTIRCDGNIYHIFKPNIFGDLKNLYQDKASMEMDLSEFKYLTSTCWKEKYQPLTTDMCKEKYQSRYRLRLNSIFVPNSNPF